MYWKPKLLSYPLSLRQVGVDPHHVNMTESGMIKLEEQVGSDDVDLKPGIDYVVRNGGDDWLPFPDTVATQSFRHTWILVRKRRQNAHPLLALRFHVTKVHNTSARLR